MLKLVDHYVDELKDSFKDEYFVIYDDEEDRSYLVTEKWDHIFGFCREFRSMAGKYANWAFMYEYASFGNLVPFKKRPDLMAICNRQNIVQLEWEQEHALATTSN